MKWKKSINFIISTVILILSLALFLLLFLTPYGFVDMSAEPEVTAETNTSGVPVIEPSNYPVIDGEKLEMEIFKEVNEIRRMDGRDPFVHSEGIRMIARLHSVDMARRNYFNHTSPEGLNPKNRHEEYDGCKAPNENIAKISDPSTSNTTLLSSRIISLWRSSPGHNKSMMTSYDNVAGVGVYVTENKSIYVTMNFCREHPNA